MTVLVIGGAGTTGSRVARKLGRLGDEARIASRSTGFDWYDPKTYAPALDGTRAVYLIPPIGEIDPAPYVERFLEVAGGRRVVLLSSSALPPHNAEHVITGPEALSCAEAAAIIATHTGTTVRHRAITADELAQRLAAHLPERFAVLLAGLGEAIGKGAEDRVTTTVEDVTGRTPRSFWEFVAAQW